MRELFDECYQLKVSVLELDETIEEIQTVLYYPKNQLISDMPKGSGGTNSAVDNLLTKLDNLRREREIKAAAHRVKWAEIVKMLNRCNASKEEKELFKLRFYKGYKWKDCIPLLNENSSGEWNENKVYSTYRLVCKKCTYI